MPGKSEVLYMRLKYRLCYTIFNVVLFDFFPHFIMYLLAYLSVKKTFKIWDNEVIHSFTGVV